LFENTDYEMRWPRSGSEPKAGVDPEREEATMTARLDRLDSG
jgi:hypothetical protein